jgi:hypothetical protein
MRQMRKLFGKLKEGNIRFGSKEMTADWLAEGLTRIERD